VKTFRILVTIAVLALVDKASGQTLTILYTFPTFADGHSQSGLIQGSDGNFYGTSEFGGDTSLCSEWGCGTVFRITPNGVLTNLHVFAGSPSDGCGPIAGVVQGGDGNFYGTTAGGGDSNNNGDGTVFQITPSGVEVNLHTFHYTDGSQPYGGLVEGSDGNFYGTTDYGGASKSGTVFRISPAGNFTNLWSFTGGADGGIPIAGLVRGTDSNFYGMTYWGGAHNCGTVFRISPSGFLTNLYSFPTPVSAPFVLYQTALIQGSDGGFYATTGYGGNTNLNNGKGYGTVFRISPSGNFTNLCSFPVGNSGFFPITGLMQGSDGNLYGTTGYGPNTNINNGCYSTVFAISPSGTLTTLYSFTGGSDGDGPSFPLAQGSDGSFYGESGGGAQSNGLVFKLSIPLNPPANQVSGFQASGADVVFTIPSVASETYQLQFATDLVSGNWSNVVGVCVSNSIGAALTVTNFGGATGPQGFYRFAITP
jgi:uncharacterized repeat protein (TIGR03803 family)